MVVVAIVIADTNNVPFYPNYGVADVMWNIGRPVIGRSEVGDLFICCIPGNNW